MTLQRKNNIPDGIEIPNNNFLIYSENLNLQETIGQGKEPNITLQKLKIYILYFCVIVVVVVVLLFCCFLYAGQFGIVYKGHLYKDVARRVRVPVAVKTIKG